MSDDDYHRRKVEREEEERRRITIDLQKEEEKERERRETINKIAEDSAQARADDIKDALQRKTAIDLDTKDYQNYRWAQDKDKQDDDNRKNAKALDEKDEDDRKWAIKKDNEQHNLNKENMEKANHDLEKEIDWQKYETDRRYRSQIDEEKNIDSGITRGTREAGHTDVLRYHFLQEGIQVPDDYELHHIIPKNEQGAAEARNILERNGIGIDDRENGVILPRGIDSPNPNTLIRHEFTFGQHYIEEITNRLKAAEKNDDVLNELRRIANDLLNP